MTDDPARRRYFIITAMRLAGVVSAVLGVILIGRATDMPQRVLGTGLVLAALAFIAVVPLSLARRWRSSPPE
jgi:drug/metabolite transporter (DMT)-like permease